MWDTTSVPDGTYVLKVAASDAPSNSPGTALIGELESVSFDIDNTPPRIELQPATRAGARTRSRSSSATSSRRCSASSIRSTRAAGGWSTRRTASPDSRREEFEVTLEESEIGRSVIIRATDAMNNVATAVTDRKSKGQKADGEVRFCLDATVSAAT